MVPPLQSQFKRHRAPLRLRAMKQGQAILSNSSSPIDCAIEFLVNGTARLQFSGYVVLPSEFRLRLAGGETVRPVALDWRKGLRAGVRFTD
jgi:hypothetical protein